MSTALESPAATKLDTANAVLATFAPDSRITREPNGWYVNWTSYHGHEYRRRWATRGQDFYPTWYRLWCHGGTASTALSQLIRWLQDKPVLPISSWRYWASETCKLLPVEAVWTLALGGYPEHVDCVLCGEQINGRLDWWSLDGVSGPCCGWTSGCRQKGAEA